MGNNNSAIYQDDPPIRQKNVYPLSIKLYYLLALKQRAGDKRLQISM